MTAKLLNGHPSDCACADCQAARAVLAIVFEHPSGCTCASCAMPLGSEERKPGHAIACACADCRFIARMRAQLRGQKDGAR